jgi:hypothetical protein
VTPVGEPRKRRRVQNLAAERRQKRKENTQGNRGSRKKLATTCRKVSRCAKVAWRKRNLLRKVQTQRKCGPRKKLAVASRNVPRRAKLAWPKRNMARKKCIRASVEQETQNGRTFGKRRWKGLEYSNGLRSRGVEEQVHLKKGRKPAKNMGGRRRHQPRLEIMGKNNKVFRKTMHLEFIKRANWTSSGLQRIKDWTLWRGRPLQN